MLKQDILRKNCEEEEEAIVDFPSSENVADAYPTFSFNMHRLKIEH